MMRIKFIEFTQDNAFSENVCGRDNAAQLKNSFLFNNQNVCFWYSKDNSMNETILLSNKKQMFKMIYKKIFIIFIKNCLSGVI